VIISTLNLKHESGEDQENHERFDEGTDDEKSDTSESGSEFSMRDEIDFLCVIFVCTLK
jgi:hypothetical protein